MAARRPAANLIREDAGERLLVEAAQKDPAKFGDLYEIHFGRVYAFIARRMRDRDKAEDLTSEVFHKALANLKSYTWTGAPFAAWLFRIAANAVSDQWKRAGREPVNVEDPPEPSGGPEQEAVGSSTAVWPGGKTSSRSAARSLWSFRRAKEYSGDCPAAWEERRSSEATAVPRVGEAQIADGGCTCLSAL